MGTCSLTCILYKGRFVVAQYSLWDGYPEGEGQGMDILKFLLVPGNIKRLEKGSEHIHHPSEEEIGEMHKICQAVITAEEERRRQILESVQSQSRFYLGPTAQAQVLEQHFPSFSRDTGAQILEAVATATADKRLCIKLSLDSANNGVCEWAYVVNLDDRAFEVFGGSDEKNEAISKRFNDIGGENDTVPALCQSIPFDKLPATEKAFITGLNKAYESNEKEKARQQGTTLVTTV